MTDSSILTFLNLMKAAAPSTTKDIKYKYEAVYFQKPFKTNSIREAANISEQINEKGAVRKIFYAENTQHFIFLIFEEVITEGQSNKDE